MKRTILIAIGSLLAVTIGLGVWFYSRGPGSAAVEQWINRQIVAIIERYINPKVNFAQLNYQYPRTVVVEDLSFTDKNEKIMNIDRLNLELAEIPRQNNPIKIKEVHLDNPRFAFIQVGEQRELAGWQHFIKTQAVKDQATAPKETRLSDVFVLQHVSIKNGEVVYDPRNGKQVMTIPGIDLTLDSPEAITDPGWHDIKGEFKREPILNVGIDGRLNLDTSLLELKKLAVKIALGESQYSALPPAIQQLLSEHRVRGELNAEMSGRIPLKDPSKTEGTIEAKLANMAFMAAAASNQAQNQTAIEAQAAGGTIRITLPQQTTNLEVTDISLKSGRDTIFSAKKVGIGLPRFPAPDQPVTITNLELDTPKLLLTPNNAGGFLGWDQFIKPDKKPPPPPPPGDNRLSTASPRDSPGDSQSPRVLFRQLTVRRGEFTYGPPTSPMALNGINLDISLPPLENQPGWYQARASIKRPPMIDGTVSGRIEINTLAITLESLNFSGTLSQTDYQSLPPQVQQYVRDHEMTGSLKLNGTGMIDIDDFDRSDAQINTVVTNASATYGDARWPLASLKLDTRIANANLKSVYDASALGGRATGELNIGLTGDNPFNIIWYLTNLRIEQTLRIAQGGNPSRSGKLSSQGRMSARLANFQQTIAGDGNVEVKEANLVNGPIIREILGLLSPTRIKGNLMQDKGSFAFLLRPTHIQLNDLKLISAIIAITGSGKIYYDGQVDMLLNAGPLKKLETALGELGKLIGALTNRVVAYRVTGTLSKPIVQVRPLGM